MTSMATSASATSPYGCSVRRLVRSCASRASTRSGAATCRRRTSTPSSRAGTRWRATCSTWSRRPTAFADEPRISHRQVADASRARRLAKMLTDDMTRSAPGARASAAEAVEVSRGSAACRIGWFRDRKLNDPPSVLPNEARGAPGDPQAADVHGRGAGALLPVPLCRPPRPSTGGGGPKPGSNPHATWKPPTGAAFNYPVGSHAARTVLVRRVIAAIDHTLGGETIRIAAYSFDRTDVMNALAGRAPPRGPRPDRPQRQLVLPPDVPPAPGVRPQLRATRASWCSARVPAGVARATST